jgi:hypothetical protein
MGTWDHLDVFDDFNTTGNLTIRIHASVPIGTWSKLADRIKQSGKGEKLRGIFWKISKKINK